MELYTLNRNFQKQSLIDGFHSIIWTERYYGDNEVELIVPATASMIEKIPLGIFLSVDGSDEIMILENRSFEEPNKIKFTGIGILPWLNNRFVRTSPNHEDRYWYISGSSIGETLWLIVFNMCVDGSPYLSGEIDIGIQNPEQFIVPGLGLGSFDVFGDPISVGVPYGPVYNALRELATPYEIGIKITLDDVSEDSYTLGFRSYMGLDRTTLQSENSIVRFSPQIESFTDIKELQSIADLKTLAYAFAPENPDGLATFPGLNRLAGELTGFDLRALQIFAEDITTDMIEGDPVNLVNILNSRARDGLTDNRFVNAIDGEIVPNNQYKYGRDYGLGDIVEVQGKLGTVQTARVTEHIRSKDATGEKSYPTVTMLGEEILGPQPPNDNWENSQLMSLECPQVGNDIPEPLHVRYIDFDDGNDLNDGLTEENAWKTVHGNGHNSWSFSDPTEDLTYYFHNGQIGPGYEYRLRGTCTEQLQLIYVGFDGEPYTLSDSLRGTEEHPIVFTSWNVVNDRVVLKGDYAIETSAFIGGDEFYWSDVYTIYLGIDFQLHGQNNVMYGNYVSFIDCTFLPNFDEGYNGASVLVYGDWLTFDRCTFRTSEIEALLLYGVYQTIQNCVFHGLNRNGGEINRDSIDSMENEGFDYPWLIYLQDSAPPFDQSDALKIINNTIVGWGGPITEIQGLGFIYADYTDLTRYHNVIIRNNIFADIMSSEEVLDLDYIGLWYIDPNLVPIIIDHNFIANDVVNFPLGSFYKNAYYTLDDSDEVITFDPDTDIFDDPKFIGGIARDLRLKFGSPAIDAGSSDLAPDHDFRNYIRDETIDMGAVEFVGHTVIGTDRYATIEEGETVLAAGATVWYKFIPDFSGPITVSVDALGLHPIASAKITAFNDVEGDHIPETLSELDYVADGDSPLSFLVEADRPYYIQVDVSDAHDAGDFVLTLECGSLVA